MLSFCPWKKTIRLSRRREYEMPLRKMLDGCSCLVLLVLVIAIAGVNGQLDSLGFINIDCGLPNPSIVDNDNAGGNFKFLSDEQFIDTGINKQISSQYSPKDISNLYFTVRSFPNGTRNCYTLRSLTVGNKYLVKGAFFYGNYDNLNRPPIFDIYLGVNYWDTVNSSVLTSYYPEIIATATADDLQVCLINTGIGTPYISWLQLKELETSMYPTVNSSQSLVYVSRFNLGASNHRIIRYPDDHYDRWWWNMTADTWREDSTNSSVGYPDSEFDPPSFIIQTAAFASSTKEALSIYWTSNNPSTKFLVVLHIVEIENIPSIDFREFDINFTAINAIKENYKVTKGWNGDPCVPIDYAWTGLRCTIYSNVPRITHLNLSSAGLTGELISSFGNLTALVSLDLSGNDLSGALGTYLDQLVALTYLDITGNENISSTLPPGLQKKQQDGTLTFKSKLGDFTQKNKKKKVPVVLIAVVGAVVLLLLAVAIILVFCLRKRPDNQIYIPKPNENSGSSPLTNNYGGNFAYSPAANISHGKYAGVKEFLAEAQNLTRVHHKNLVSLLGYSMDGDCMALVYEYMQEGTLQDKLRDNGRPLSWKQRLRVACESAQGLEYLHKACNPPLIHRDVKTNNILLNSNLDAKIADFGLSRAFNNASSHVSTAVVGTPGYLDPEYYQSYQLSEKSDVFSFGVVLLEIITGKPPIIAGPEGGHLAKWVTQKISKGDIESVVDPRMHGQYDINSVWKVTALALKCTEHSSVQRPTMTVVVAELKESLDLEISTEGTRSGRTINMNPHPHNYSRNDNFISDVSQNSVFEMGYMDGMTAPGPAAR
ncbi:Leucine-rich repeat protein kinase family protein [Rhynchospora pubera]|uniref:non-specific serine/threonine protein kinase n=1 Tax=Rhynchospora pubera TaxID=906938 RepID=A0AAV8DZ00_9POAL|nr:Leucine-rich repeat protein kinase family protein [Rhynchospora pubera]